ncbi:MAG: GNAT family N-acetyltransferase [Acutalibacteraceae bacterium]|nr:GNAT family N-acetyltransferase [Acutalibacteraceae bacterium]
MFQNEQFIIREYKSSDVTTVWNTLNNYQIYITTYGIPHPCDIKYAKKWIKDIKTAFLTKASYEYAIINKKNGAYMGNVGLINIDNSSRRCDITYFIDPLYQNHGIATQASAIMIKYAFEELGMVRVGGMCMDSNPASARVMEKLKMTYEGTLRNYFFKENTCVNAKNYSILLEEYAKLRGSSNN